MKELVAALLPKNFSSDFNEDDEILCIHVRRTTFLLEDALREGGKKKFVPGRKLKVCRLLSVDTNITSCIHIQGGICP